MTTEPWFEGQTAGWIGGIAGSAVGVLGAVFGSLCGWLVPKGRGKTLLQGMTVGMAVVGVACLLTAAAALALGQPYAVWYTFLLPGFLLTLFGLIFFRNLRAQYRAVELRRMHAQELQ